MDQNMRAELSEVLPLKNITNIDSSKEEKSAGKTSRSSSVDTHSPAKKKHDLLPEQALDTLYLALSSQDSTRDLLAGIQAKTSQQLLSELEQRGALTKQLLLLFASLPEITSLSLSETYGAQLNEAGLPFIRTISTECTVALYKGFDRLQSLDCTNVPLADNDLRYLIRLRSLRALSLSGTSITQRGLKYLAKHALFVHTLRCLKLCYVLSVDDLAMPYLCAFSSLCDLDLFCASVSVSGLLLLADKQLRLRISPALFDQIQDRCVCVEECVQTHDWFPRQPAEVDQLGAQTVHRCLVLLKDVYRSIYINYSLPEASRLKQMLLTQQSERRLWNMV